MPEPYIGKRQVCLAPGSQQQTGVRTSAMRPSKTSGFAGLSLCAALLLHTQLHRGYCRTMFARLATEHFSAMIRVMAALSHNRPFIFLMPADTVMGDASMVPCPPKT